MALAGIAKLRFLRDDQGCDPDHLAALIEQGPPRPVRQLG